MIPAWVRATAANNRRTLLSVAALVLVATVVAAFWLRPPPRSANTVVSSGFAEAEQWAGAIAGGLKPALEELARRTNADRAAIGAVNQKADAIGTRVKTIEDRPPIDLKKLEEELRTRILKSLPESVPLSQLRDLQKEVAQLRENFPKRSAV